MIVNYGVDQKFQLDDNLGTERLELEWDDDMEMEFEDASDD